MIELKSSAKEIAKDIKGDLIGKDCLIEGISIDTRENLNGDFCYFAIKGERYDGHDYIDVAIKNGAKLVVSEKRLSLNIPVIYVENTVKALGYLAKSRKRKTKIIGVTGSVGKTTTKDMIISVLREKYKVTGTRENQNNEIGVALTLLSIKDEDFCIVEMGARKKGDIEWLTYISEPDVAVITNCGSSHIEYFGSEQGIFDEKIKIMSGCKVAIAPKNNQFCNHNYGETHSVFVGADGYCFFNNIKVNKNKISGDIWVENKKVIKLKSQDISKKAFENALFAFVIGKLYGISDYKIRNGIKKCKRTKLRTEVIKAKGAIIINDTYNASYESTIASIDMLYEYGKKYKRIKIAVFGDMLELGEKSSEYHRNVGKHCKIRGIDEIYTLGIYGMDIIQGCGNGRYFNSKDELINELLKIKLKNKIMLFKASRKLGFEKIVEVLKEKLNG